MPVKQLPFQWLPQYTKAKWTFKCLCWQCLRILELPAATFLQGDPVCICGGTHITAEYHAREMMLDLEEWNQAEPMTWNNKKILTWSKDDGATFEK